MSLLEYIGLLVAVQQFTQMEAPPIDIREETVRIIKGKSGVRYPTSELERRERTYPVQWIWRHIFPS